MKTHFLRAVCMPQAILLPALSPTMTQGHLVKWHKNPGDTVRSGDLLMEVETDKATMEVEATQEGILDYIAVCAPAYDIQVGQLVAVLRHAEEPANCGQAWAQAQYPEAPSASGHNAQDTLSQANVHDTKSATMVSQPPISSVILSLESPQPTPESASQNADPKSQLRQHPPHAVASSRRLASPLARKLAQHHCVDLAHIHGSGPGGRIVQKDILAHIQTSTHMGPSAPDASASDIQTSQHAMSIPVTPIRQIIAKRLTISKQSIPHFYLSIACEMDALLAVRTQLNIPEKRFSVNDFMLRGCALALRDHPPLRTLWDDQGPQMIQHAHVDLAMAVSVPGGLITPIVPKAETKTLTQLAGEAKDLVARARTGHLKPHEYQGGTFTISNLGMFGVTQFQPIINPPHPGILAIGATQPMPIVKNNTISIAHIMNLTLAADHRVVDGQQAAEFLQTLKNYLENPLSMLA